MQVPGQHQKDLYLLLGIARTASHEEIRKAYRAKALKWHPDKVEESQREQAEEVFKDIKRAYEILSDVERRQMYDRYGAAYLEPDFEPAMFAPQVPFAQPVPPFQPPFYQYPQPVPKPFRPHFMHTASSSSFASAYSSPPDRSPHSSPAAPYFQAPFAPYNHPQPFQYPYAAQPPTPGSSYPSTPISGCATGYTTPIHFPPSRSTSVPVPAQDTASSPLFQQPPLPPAPVQPPYYMPPPTSPPSKSNSPPQSPPTGYFVPPSADYFSRGASQQWAGRTPPAPMTRNYGVPPSAPVSRSASSASLRPTPQRAWTEQSPGYRVEPQPVPQPKRRGWFGRF